MAMSGATCEDRALLSRTNSVYKIVLSGVYSSVYNIVYNSVYSSAANSVYNRIYNLMYNLSPKCIVYPQYRWFIHRLILNHSVNKTASTKTLNVSAWWLGFATFFLLFFSSFL